MRSIRRSVASITLVQEDLEPAKAFYASLFDKPPDYSDGDVAVFHVNNIILNLETASAAQNRIAPAAVANQDAGSRVVLTIWVDDADQACAELSALGVTLINGPKDQPWGMRTACFADPGGHIWSIGQDLEPQPGA